ncbi:MAG: hypothetical protein H7Z75_21670 [Ferruginibacter sp.]|nr:hypothetical protein [Cytophagales bacterium]
MQLIEVNTRPLTDEFLLFPVRLYGNDPHYIRPLDKDVETVFDQGKNKLFKHGECIRWILRDDRGRAIGRVAAFINHKTAYTYDQPTGGMGFFECVDDQRAASTLFDACREWLQERNMEAMDGPVNFGDRDKWWGLLVDNFSPPTYGVNYNFPYYQPLFEAYGFRLYFKQYTYYRSVDEKLRSEYYAKAEAILTDPNYHFRHIEKNHLARYAEDFRTVYNRAWVRHEGVKEMTDIQARSIMKKLKPVLDERIVWFAYYQQEPVGFFIGLPELNELFRHVNGKLDALGTLKFLWHRWRGTCKTMYGIAFGIAPEHQRKGVEAAMIVAASRVVQNKGLVKYEHFVMNWIGDFNPKMMAVAEQVGGSVYKTHHTYRKLFDETQPFHRAPVID